MTELAINGGTPSKTKPFPAWPQYDQREQQALIDVLESRKWWRTEGTCVTKFEQEFAAFHGAKHGIAITNGTHALEVALAALGVVPGDEVIVPDSTFVATASSVLFAGAMPVMVDICRDTECIDPDLVEAAITPRTKGIIPVHLGGHPADLDRLTEIASRHGLFLLEDCAHAHGSEWNGKKVGTHSVAGTFSFQSSKLMTAGEGGIIITNDDEVERNLRSVHDCGRLPGEWFYSHFAYGSNYRLSEWQGAVLQAQLERLDQQTRLRDANGAMLDRLLAEIPGITPQARDPRCTLNGHYAYIFHFDNSEFAGISTERFTAAMNAEGIRSQAPYPEVHKLDMFQNGAYKSRLSGSQAEEEHAFLRADYPNSRRAATEDYWIPQYCLLGDEQDMEEIVAAIKKIQANAASLG
ncbi:MAG: DegT/DnrJ/EryC1/StrS family aminotransferase [Planctomycetales bacterium]|nr:DegT/DnrJ/EryC1/StrS family aminotransferase [Planctomycetales bacterium]